MFLLIHLEEPYANFLRSAEWKELSLRVIQRAGGVCECCGVKPAVSALWSLRFGISQDANTAR
jgi:hypothetical protein